MIGRIRGELISKEPPWLLVEAYGVGYELEAPMSVFYRLPDVGREVIVYTHFVVREDAQLLYGFSSIEERGVFRTLIRINGVGPKLALTLLSGIELSDLVRSVQQGDSATLVRLPGIGKKTAERLIVEMRDKLEQWQVLPSAVSSSGVVTVSDDGVNAEQEAVSALVALGYRHQDASRMVKALSGQGLGREELIRQSLKSTV